MSFSKNDLDLIKSKITLSNEIEKKTKLIKKGKDYWCCCLFHEEKTPSCKINDDLGSFYCFGCGAKGDIFTIYTEMYNFSFPDAVRELSKKVGLNISEENFSKNKKDERIFKIIELSTQWYENNLKLHKFSKEYLKNRSLSDSTINKFRIGYSNNPKTTLYSFLKKNNFSDNDILSSNVVKLDSNNKIRDFFYKRLIFPIFNEQNKVIGFGGRVLDNSNPKYINSPESRFFKKRNILYNLNEAKKNIRTKKNMLICEGYMDVISLYENNITTAVAPLGTSFTEEQLKLSWKYVDKPTIMFDGDTSGIRASYKAALMTLPFLIPNKFIQFVILPENLDPDTYINKYSLKDLIKILKKPLSIIEFIFTQSVSSLDLKNADNKVSYDKYIDDISNTISNNKIKYFYKSELKRLFFEKLKTKNKKINLGSKLSKIDSLKDKQILSFIAAFVFHIKIRKVLRKILIESNLLNKEQINFINFISDNDLMSSDLQNNENIKLPKEISEIIEKCSQNSIFQLFPYSSKSYETNKTLNEIKDSVENLNTRLLNLKKINKSLNEFNEKKTTLSWDELKNINLNRNEIPEEKS